MRYLVPVAGVLMVMGCKAAADGTDAATASSDTQGQASDRAAIKSAETERPAGVDCKALVQDVAWLEDVYERVTAPNYEPTKNHCDQITKQVNGRFSLTWGKQRRVPPFYKPGEPVRVTAARTFEGSCVQIVFGLACDGKAKLKKMHGTDVVKTYERDFRKFSSNLKSQCASSSGRP